MNDHRIEPSSPFLRPGTFLLGFALGVLALAWFGRQIVKRDWHPNFQRLAPMQAPDSQYVPTIEEMQAIVRARCRPDQILVIVGGNSIFVGVGQPVANLWSRHLQELLGPKYVVLNFALRGASMTDGAAVLAESLFKEYPRQIYITNTSPFGAADSIGGDSYREFFYDAYYKHLLLPWPPRDYDLNVYYKNRGAAVGFEYRTYARLDAIFRFRNIWNWWTMTHFATFPSERMPTLTMAFLPRKHFKDEEPDYELTPYPQRFPSQVVQADLKIAEQISASHYTKDSQGEWQQVKPAFDQFKWFGQRAFPDVLKKRTLITISLGSPLYTSLLTKDERERDASALRDNIQVWKDLGYQAIWYGDKFSPEDYGDRSHLTKHGGKKVAEILAPKVREVAVSLGYTSTP